MTIKNRLSLFISGLITLLLGISSAIVIILYSDFRQDEFKLRLEKKAINTIILLSQVKDLDEDLIRIFDKNTINNLYDEKTLIFEENNHLVYSSLDNIKITWNEADLKFLKNHHSFFKEEGVYEVYGISYRVNGKLYYSIISASDNFGKRKLQYLIILLSVTCVSFSIAGWGLTHLLVKKLIFPLKIFLKRISSINENNLETRFSINQDSKNEIDLMAKEFNLMMNRIEIAYQKQKEFTAQASHELRTPLARIMTQLENLKSEPNIKNPEIIDEVLQNTMDLHSLIESLLILTKVENINRKAVEKSRIDEILYNSIEATSKQYPEIKVIFEIEDSPMIMDFLEVSGNSTLLEIAFSNLLKNAYLYSNDRQAKVYLSLKDSQLEVNIQNNGDLINEEEIKNIFQPFYRGKNASGRSGLGIGLRIVERILTVYHFQIFYHIENSMNNFTIRF